MLLNQPTSFSVASDGVSPEDVHAALLGRKGLHPSKAGLGSGLMEGKASLWGGTKSSSDTSTVAWEFGTPPTALLVPLHSIQSLQRPTNGFMDLSHLLSSLHNTLFLPRISSLAQRNLASSRESFQDCPGQFPGPYSPSWENWCHAGYGDTKTEQAQPYA